MYDRSLLDDIRDRISISSLIGERIPLKRAGRTHKGLCPFHQEKTPSFNVSDEKGIFHCFGCGEGGDIFQFLMKFEGIGFVDAVKDLAARAGVELPKQVDPHAQSLEEERSRKRKLLLRTNQVAMEHFIANLSQAKVGAVATQYLQDRGISEEKSAQHFLGYADNRWDALVAYLEGKGVPRSLASELGLIKERDGGGYYDFFRHRVIFPIRSPRGDVLGFGGRILEGEEGPEKGAKYLNSPDSTIYHKSSSVYGLDRSQPAIRAQDQVVLVEGYMDFIALFDAGIENVAAPLGTALTQGHIVQLARMTRNFILLFDGDAAGRRAAFRALPLFLETGIMPRIVLLPAGEDPDTVIRKEGALSFRKRLAEARSLFEQFVEATVAESGLDAAGKVAAVREIVPLLSKVSDPMEGSVLRQYVARRLDMDERSIVQSLKAQQQGRTQRSASLPQRRDDPSSQGEQAPRQVDALERMLMKALLSRPALIPSVFERLGPGQFVDDWCRTVATIILNHWQGSQEVQIGSVIEGVEDEQLAASIRAVAMASDTMEDREAEQLVQDCVEGMLNRPARDRMGRINEEIRRAEVAGDEERVVQLMTEKQTLVATLRGVREG